MKPIIFTVIFLLLNNCTTLPETKPPAEPPIKTSKQFIFWVLGGNSSCRGKTFSKRFPYKSGIYKRFMLLMNSSSINYEYVLSCFSTSGKLYFVTSKSKSLNKISVNGFINYAETNSKNRKVVILGHSYGGWLSIKVATALSFKPIHALFTIDPISKVNCPSMDPKGCRRAPKDISKDKLIRISKVTDHWYNYYQTKTLFLKSSKIPEAHVNKKINTNHIKIGTNATIWSDIKKVIAM